MERSGMWDECSVQYFSALVSSGASLYSARAGPPALPVGAMCALAHLNRRPYPVLRVGRLSMAPRILSAAMTLLLMLAVAFAAARGRCGAFPPGRPDQVRPRRRWPDDAHAPTRSAPDASCLLRFNCLWLISPVSCNGLIPQRVRGRCAALNSPATVCSRVPSAVKSIVALPILAFSFLVVSWAARLLLRRVTPAQRWHRYFGVSDPTPSSALPCPLPVLVFLLILSLALYFADNDETYWLPIHWTNTSKRDSVPRVCSDLRSTRGGRSGEVEREGAEGEAHCGGVRACGLYNSNGAPKVAPKVRLVVGAVLTGYEGKDVGCDRGQDDLDMFEETTTKEGNNGTQTRINAFLVAENSQREAP
ncbi:hypothetical protein B0H17DRAFT_1187721 [Mycena rosella]|uniref:Uncharacterized protein n=1 Tax=Mycena rosella TaxID=1033263 RepID=A0AAD7BV27_MYCRO|nr:hypothetical protein B0H17DRAFT_1187721 [Mycena rosella]